MKCETCGDTGVFKVHEGESIICPWGCRGKPVEMLDSDLIEGALAGSMLVIDEARTDMENAGAPKGMDFNDQIKWIIEAWRGT